MTDLSARAPSLQGLGQRRNLTILFADLSDSTRLAESVEAEHYALMLAQLRALYQRLVPKHGGMVVRIQGDGMLAIFGHPEAREDDGRRATEAALELHEAVRGQRPPAGWSQPLSLHSGIHAGLVLIDEGDDVRGRFELLGNAPNIAARLSDAARAGEILVSEETLGLHGHFFATSERQSLQLKGRAVPLAVFAIHGRAAIGRRFEASVQRGLTPFVGREQELAQLELMLDAALRGDAVGRARWVSLRAGAGVGKTRLTEELLHRAAVRRCQIHRGYCESYLSAEPLQPFLQMLAALPEALPEVQQARQSPPKARPQALLDLMAAQALGSAPQLIFIDDLQWADDASLVLLHRLLALAAEQSLPLFVLTATRPRAPGDVIPAAGDGEAVVLELQPFSDEEAAAAVLQLLPRTDPFLAAEVQRHAGGNALFIEELCHALANEVGDGAAPRRLGEAQPGNAWLSALVESRMARLPPLQLLLLRVAAVIGNVIPVWLLERLIGRPADDPAVQQLAEQDFVFPDQRPGQLRFKHGITRDVVYEAIGLHDRQALHKRVAAELRAAGGEAAAGPAAHELLAYHDGAAGDYESASHHAEAAGDQALAVSAHDRAKKQYRAALAALEHLPNDETYRLRWISIAQRFGHACVFDASRADLRVLQHAAELARSSEDPALIARAEYWLGYVSYALGEARRGLPHCERGLAAAERVADAGLIAQLRGTLGQLRAAAADYAPALVLLDDAIQSQRDQPRRPGRLPVGLAYSLACKAQVLGDQGRFDASDEVFAESLQIVGGSGHAIEASVQGCRAAVLLWQGRWAEARHAAAEARRVGAQVRSLFTFSMGHAAGAYGAWMESREPSSLAALQDATAWLAPRGGGLFSSLNHGWLAELLVAQGQARAARHHIGQALRRCRQHDTIGVAMAYRAAARLAAQQGQAAAVERYLEQARHVAERRGAAHETAVTQLCAAEIAIGQGRGAGEMLDAAETAFEMLGMAWHLAAARQLRASLS